MDFSSVHSTGWVGKAEFAKAEFWFFGKVEFFRTFQLFEMVDNSLVDFFKADKLAQIFFFFFT